MFGLHGGQSLWAIRKERKKIIFDNVSFSAKRTFLAFIQPFFFWDGNVKKVGRTFVRLMLYKYYGYAFYAFLLCELGLGQLLFLFFWPFGLLYIHHVYFNDFFALCLLKKVIYMYLQEISETP